MSNVPNPQAEFLISIEVASPEAGSAISRLVLTRLAEVFGPEATTAFGLSLVAASAGFLAGMIGTEDVCKALDRVSSVLRQTAAAECKAAGRPH